MTLAHPQINNKMARAKGTCEFAKIFASQTDSVFSILRLGGVELRAGVRSGLGVCLCEAVQSLLPVF